LNPIVASFSNAGFTFSGWNTSADGTGQTYGVGATYGLPYNVTLYALWIPTGNTVVFAANGGSGSMASESFTAGVAQALTSNAFTRSGYSFTGWNTASDGTGTSYTDGQSVTVGSGLTLYAQWSPTAAFKNNDGSTTYSSTSVVAGTSITLPASETLPVGYVAFVGWATASGATSATYAPGASYTVSGPVTLYAVFTPATYAVALPINVRWPPEVAFRIR